jgi:hypothetical protein
MIMAANTQESQEHNYNNYESCVYSNNIAIKHALIMSNIAIGLLANPKETREVK